MEVNGLQDTRQASIKEVFSHFIPALDNLAEIWNEDETPAHFDAPAV